MICHIVPPYLLERLAVAAERPAAARAAAVTLEHQATLRAEPFPWTTPTPPTVAVQAAPPGAATAGLVRTIGDAEQTETLPGRIVRREGDPAVGDPAPDEAYDALGATYAFFDAAYGRKSVDGADLGLDATVHYGVEYDNAFWDGAQMVFGDGDGEVFTRFTSSVSVIGHELAHGVTQFTANLTYRNQSGALNESMSDVFGVLVEQYALQQTADEADWLIGRELFTDEVQGVALRSLKDPGTAYDDDVLGKDPQPAHMDDYVQTFADNGGVHINSGIPNKAFYLTAAALGGFAWERAGQIWFDALTGGELSSEAQFADFAALTVAAATARYGDGAAELNAVTEAWASVGVDLSGSTSPGPGAPQPADGPVWTDPDVTD